MTDRWFVCYVDVQNDRHWQKRLMAGDDRRQQEKKGWHVILIILTACLVDVKFLAVESVASEFDFVCKV